MLQALTAIPAPSGGAVKIVLYFDHKDAYALILASETPHAPDPHATAGVRTIHAGRLRNSQADGSGLGSHAYQQWDFNSASLQDGEPVFYHAFEMDPAGNFGPPLTVSAVPDCARSAVVVIARDVLRQRLSYHLARAIRDELVVGVEEIPVVEQEVREEGLPLPAIFMRESVNPDPSAETVGHMVGVHRDAHTPDGVKEYRFAYQVRIGLLLLCDNPDDRTNLERYLAGALDADRDLFPQMGLEAPVMSRFTRHDVDEGAGVDTYGSEMDVSCTVYTRVLEDMARATPDVARRAGVTPRRLSQ